MKTKRTGTKKEHGNKLKNDICQIHKTLFDMVGTTSAEELDPEADWDRI